MNAFLPACRRTFRSVAHRRLLDRQRLPLTPGRRGGAREATPLSPVGEYAQSLPGPRAHLRVLLAANGTPGRLLRLNYATELRYGVLVDVARRCTPASRSTWRWATSTPSGRATPTRWRWAALSPPPASPTAAAERRRSRRRCRCEGPSASSSASWLGKPWPRFLGQEADDSPALSNGQLGHRAVRLPARAPCCGSWNGSPTGCAT